MTVFGIRVQQSFLCGVMLKRSLVGCNDRHPRCASCTNSSLLHSLLASCCNFTQVPPLPQCDTCGMSSSLQFGLDVGVVVKSANMAGMWVSRFPDGSLWMKHGHHDTNAVNRKRLVDAWNSCLPCKFYTCVHMTKGSKKGTGHHASVTCGIWLVETILDP